MMTGMISATDRAEIADVIAQEERKMDTPYGSATVSMHDRPRQKSDRYYVCVTYYGSDEPYLVCGPMARANAVICEEEMQETATDNNQIVDLYHEQDVPFELSM